MSEGLITTNVLYEAVQSLSTLPGPFNAEKASPVMTFDATQLVNSVGILWEAVKEQRSFIQVLEKELTKRKTETEVKLKNMRSDMETHVQQEARKREAEDERIRREMREMKKSVTDVAEQLRDDMKAAEDRMGRDMERTVMTTRAAVSDLSRKVEDHSIAITELKEEMRSTTLRCEVVETDSKRLDGVTVSNHQNLCSFIGASPHIIADAVKRHTEKDVMLQTPAFNAISQRIRVVDDKCDAARNEVAMVSSTVKHLDNHVSTISGDVIKMKAELPAITESQVSADGKLSRRIDEIDKSLALMRTGSRPIVQPSATTIGTSEYGKLQKDVTALVDSLDLIKEMLNGKADVEILSSLNADMMKCLDGSVESINSRLDDHDVTLTQLSQALNNQRQGGPITAAAAPAPPQKHTSVDGEKLKNMQKTLDQLVEDMRTAAQQLGTLENKKADRKELHAALNDILKRNDRALQNLLMQLNASSSASGGSSKDSTAGRFRCISCNRDAGPLMEPMAERLSKQQFPPSSMLVSGSGGAGSGGGAPTRIINSRQSVPGLREYSASSGGNMTTSRKKLMNYYQWLQDKNDEASVTSSARPSRPTSAGTRRDSPNNRPKSPSHPWSGAQSGNGYYGERQCGDHGTPEPDAIGLDGKYYVGVSSREGSRDNSPAGRLDETIKESDISLSPNQRPKSAPLNGRQHNAQKKVSIANGMS